MHWTPPTPALQSGPLVLRSFRIQDAKAVSAACADPEIVRFTFMPAGISEADAGEWITSRNASWGTAPRFAIADARNDRVLGQVGMAWSDRYLSAEAYYWVLASERGRGVASTALALVADWAFDGGVERLFLLTHLENEASQRVASRCGFTREGVLRGFEPFKGSRPDLVSWSLLRDDARPWRTR